MHLSPSPKNMGLLALSLVFPNPLMSVVSMSVSTFFATRGTVVSSFQEGMVILIPSM